MSVPVTRNAVRVLLLDEADRVLLVRFWDGARSWWCPPGGGIEPGESDPVAAARELREELGDAPVAIGPCVWTRRHVGIFRGRPFDQGERILLGRALGFDPRPSAAALREHGLDDTLPSRCARDEPRGAGSHRRTSRSPSHSNVERLSRRAIGQQRLE